MTEQEFQEILLTLRALNGAIGELAEAVKSLAAKAPPSSRRGGK